MSDYTGKKCLCCGESFSDSDDIVVCPDCGTPYHRACYAAEQRCVNDELHSTGESWKQQQKRQDSSVCRICGEHNEPDAVICAHCGRSLSLSGTTVRMYDDSEIPPVTPPPLKIQLGDRLCGLSPEEDFDGVKVSEIADYIGANTYYYLPRFKHMKETGRKLSFNFMALLFSSFFLASRKMRKPAYLSILVLGLITLPYQLVSMSELWPNAFGVITEFVTDNSVPYSMLMLVLSAVQYVIFFIIGGFSNWLYYRQVIKEVKLIKSESLSPEECSKKLRLAGGTSFREVLVAVLLKLALTLIIIVGTHLILNLK